MNRINADRQHLMDFAYRKATHTPLRPRIQGSKPCLGRCGRTIAMNKSMCLHCMVLWEAEVERRAQAKREADALTTQAKAIEQEEERTTPQPDATGYSGDPSTTAAEGQAG